MYIIFEGPDKCGKSTQVKLLGKYLEENGYKCHLTKEPGSTNIGKEIRKILLKTENTDINKYCEYFLYIADRMQHYSNLLKYEDRIIISDRSFISTIVYQHVCNNIDPDLTQAIYKYLPSEYMQFLFPNLVFILNIDFKTFIERCNEVDKSEISRFEQLKQKSIERIQHTYSLLKALLSSSGINVVYINASDKSIENIHKQVVEHVNKLLNIESRG